MRRLRLIIVLLCSVLIHVILFVYLTNRITFKLVDNDSDPIEVEMFQKIQSQVVDEEQNSQAKSTEKKQTPLSPDIQESIQPVDIATDELFTYNENNQPEPRVSENQGLCDQCLEIKTDQDEISYSAYGDSIRSIHLRFMVFHDLGPNKQQHIEPFGQKQENTTQTRTKNHIGYVDIFYTREDDRYSLEFMSDNIGLANLYLNQLYQKSSGLITKSGLQPITYQYKYGESIHREVTFDWQQNKAVINNQKRIKTKDLPPQTQDQLSVLFNFMFLDPLKVMNIPVTNGKNLKIYHYLFSDEGVMEVNKTRFNFVHIEKISEKTEKLNLWLAKEYGFLPIKIIMTEEDSSLIIQELIEFQINS
jgi:hypothetical protein